MVVSPYSENSPPAAAAVQSQAHRTTDGGQRERERERERENHRGPALKKPKACLPCHTRKVRCDASVKGLPCSRCVGASKVEECVYARGHPKRSAPIPASTPSQVLQTLIRTNSRRRARPQPDMSMQRAAENLTSLSQPRACNGCGSVNEHPSLPQYAAPDLDGYSMPYAEQPTSQTTTSNVRASIREDLYPVPPAHPEDARPQNHLSPEIALPDADPSERESITEEDVQMHICQDIASGRVLGPGTAEANLSYEIIEYQNKMTATSILGELLSKKKIPRLVKIVMTSPGSSADGHSPGQGFRRVRDLELSGLDVADQAFLNSKFAFHLPPRDVCEEFLRIYFVAVYPYAPILDRRKLLQSYETDQYSSFLFQALLTNVVPYASIDLIQRAGFSNHRNAQKAFFKRATVLYDLGCEKSQLHLLQGSLLLGSQWVSFAADKDYRFWLLNAIRLATRMGLHREDICEDLDPATHKLLRRIWWVIYTRDVLITVSGLENARYINISNCDTKQLTEDDWFEEDSVVSPELESLLPPVTQLQRLYIVETSRLASIGEMFSQTIHSVTPGKIEDDAIKSLVDAFTLWRDSLPKQLRIEGANWVKDNIWILVLMAWCYRLECMVYRSLVQHYKKNGTPSQQEWASQKLYTTLFEVDVIIRRAIMHQVVPLLPMSFSTAVSTVVALHVGIVLDSSLDSSQRCLSESSIKFGLDYLRNAQQNWSSLQWTIRMFDWVFKKTGLDVGNTPETTRRQRQNDFLQTPETDCNQTVLDALNGSDISTTGLWDFDPSFMFDDGILDLEDRMTVAVPRMS